MAIICLRHFKRQLNTIDITLVNDQYSISKAIHLCKCPNITNLFFKLNFQETPNPLLIKILRENLPKLKKLVQFSLWTYSHKEALKNLYDIIPQFEFLHSLTIPLYLDQERQVLYAMSLAEGLAKRKILVLNLILLGLEGVGLNFVEFFSNFPLLERFTISLKSKLKSGKLNELGTALFQHQSLKELSVIDKPNYQKDIPQILFKKCEGFLVKHTFTLECHGEYEPKITKILSTELVCLTLETRSFPNKALDELWTHLMKMVYLRDFSLTIHADKMHNFDCAKIAYLIKNCINLRSISLTTNPFYPDEEQWSEICHSLKLSKINKLYLNCNFDRVTWSYSKCLKLLQSCYGMQNELIIGLRITSNKPLSMDDNAFMSKITTNSAWRIRKDIDKE